MKNFKIIISIFLISLLSSCFLLNHTFKLTNSYIKSNKSFYQGFSFLEIKVDSLNSEGIPVKYNTLKSANLFIDNPKGKQSKKIFFYKRMNNYYWMYSGKTNLPVLPIQMKKNHWYKIDGLVFFGNPILSKFIYIDTEGNCQSYTEPNNTNW